MIRKVPTILARNLPFYLFSLFSFLFPSKISAQVNIGSSFFSRQQTQFGDTFYRFRDESLGSVISLLLPNVIMVAGLIFMYLIIYGGYMLIVYGGQANSPGRVQQGKNSITYGVLGLLLVVSSYFILQIISTVTGINFLNSPIL
jgi:hypothetical protein